MSLSFAPLSYTLPGWPSHLFGPLDLLDRVGMKDFAVVTAPGQVSGSGAVVWLEELELKASGLDQVSVAFLSSGGIGQLDFTFTLLPDFSLAFPDLSATLRIRTPLLKRVKLQGGAWVADNATNGDPKPLEIELSGVGVAVTAEGDVSFTAQPALALSPFEIGSSGIVVETKGLQLYLDATAAPPTGADPGFKGVAIQQANLHLTGGLGGAHAPDTVSLTDLLIGSTGFSGHIEAHWAGANRQCQLFGLDCELDSLAFDFKQNVPVGGAIKAKLTLPFFERPVEVEIGYTADGGLTVGLAGTSPAGLTTLNVGQVLALELDSLKLTLDDGLVTARLSGRIIPTLSALKCPPIRVDNLTIDSKGHVNLPGGWLPLPQQYGLKFHGFQIDITKFGLGVNDDGSKWIGFSGGIKLVDGLPAGVSVDGLRITSNHDWTATPDFTLSGVGVELELKNVLYFKGAVAFRTVSGGHRFDGSIRLELKALKFNLDGQFVCGDTLPAGSTVSYRYMGLYVDLDLPTPIMVGATGLACFSISGLFALRMAPDKKPDEKWYEIPAGQGWYKRSPLGITDVTQKWEGRPGALGLGFGAVFGTAADNGHAFNMKAMFVVNFPGVVCLIQGAANIAKDRAKLDDDPLFRALTVIDTQAASLLIGLDVAYRYDEASGKLIKLSAGTEAFYDFDDPEAWHINLGLQTPTEQRIQARVFDMFDANAYLMLSAHKLAMGAWVGYDRNWKFGPLKVGLQAWMESNVLVSTKPPQIWGDMALHGGVDLEAFGIGLSLTVDANVQAEVFRPKHLLAELEVELQLPSLRKKKKRSLKADLSFEIGPDPVAPPIPLALKGVSIEHFKTSVTWPLPAANGLLKPVYDDGQGFLASPSGGGIDDLPPLADIPVVPLDGRPSLHFARNVHDDALVGVLVQPPSPDWEWIGNPDKHEGAARVRWRLTSVFLEKLDGGSWTAVAGKGAGASGLPELFGSWAPAPGSDGTGVAQNRLTLYSKCGFDSFRNGGGEYAAWFAGALGGANGFPCVPAPPPTEICLDFSTVPPGPVASPFTHPDYPGVSFEASQGTRLVVEDHFQVAGAPRSLCSHGKDGFDILFSSPADHLQVQTLGYGFGATSITAEDAGGAELGPITVVNALSAQDQYDENIARIWADDVSRVHVSGVGQSCLTEICMIAPPGPDQLQAAASALTRNQTSGALWSQTGAVLEPHTVYRLRVTTTIEVEAYKYDLDFNVPRVVEQAAFFRTDGPPGLVTLDPPLEPAPTGDFRSGLEDLTRYVVQTLPPTVPATGQAPVLPRPVFRAYDVGVYAFNEDYVELMYRLGGRDLAVMLYDRNNQPVRGRNGAVAVADNPWGVTEGLSLSGLESQWLSMLAANSCVPDVDQTSIPKDQTLTAPAEVLAPDMLYQARLVPLLLHEDFAHVGSGLGRWRAVDFPSADIPSSWAVDATVAAPATVLRQTAFVNSSAVLGTAVVLGADPRAPAEDPALWADYRVSALIRADGGAAIGLAFRWVDDQNFYLFNMDERSGAGRRLYKVAGGVATPIAYDGVLFSHGHDYEVVVEAIGPSLKVWVEGQLVFDVADTASPYLTGTVGLHCSGTDLARFSEVRVYDLAPGAKSAYGFSFTTSRFVDFAHQVQSHDDDAWPGLCTLDSATLAAVLGQAVSDTTTPVSDAEARAFETLADDILGPYARQEAPRTETCRVASGDDLIALMVRSPEPFDFPRVTFGLSHVTEEGPASVAPGAVKLAAAVLGATDTADETVTILARERTDLSGWRLELRDPATPAPERLDDPAASWTELYRFDQEAPPADATTIVIRADGPPTSPSPDTPRLVTRYRAAGGDPGVIALGADHVDLRLVDRSGRVQHARRFHRDGLYAALGFRALRKADGTGLVLLPAGGAAFPAGDLRLSAAFRRDNRAADADSLVLSVGGDRSAETTWIDIPTAPPLAGGPAAAVDGTASWIDEEPPFDPTPPVVQDEFTGLEPE